MGAVVLGAMALYVLISIGVVIWAIKYARRNRRSVWRWGTGAALVMYLLVFWDHIPTLIAHKYYCEKEAGFWVYKTVEQWKAENPGAMETLVAYKGVPSRHERFNDGHGKTDIYLLNERFNWVVRQEDFSRALPIIRTEQEVKDIKKGELLARYVDYGTGNSVKYTVGPPGPWKVWMKTVHCSGGEFNRGQMYSFEHSVRGAEK